LEKSRSHCFEVVQLKRLMKNNHLYTAQETSEFLGVSANTVRRWGKNGKIRVIDVQGQTRVPADEIRRIKGVGKA
jgi:excisionase family DNA binding protein